MGIVSDIETYFVKTGKIRDYTSRVANNSEVISIQIPVPATGLQQIYLPQNTLLDSHKLRAIQIIADDEQFYGFTSRGTTVENLPVTSLPNFILSMGINNVETASIPFTSMHRPSNNGKFCFFDSEIGNHIIGDCFIQQAAIDNQGGKIITLKFWYD